MNKWVLTLLLFSFCGGVSAQHDSIFSLAGLRGTGVRDFNVDQLGNVYMIMADGQLKKTNGAGDSVAVFNNIRKNGRLHSIDVSNPLKTLLFYRDFGTIVVLDRFLNERTTIDLRSIGLPQVRAVGQSYDNHLWVFDELELKLKKISDEGRLLDQSTDLRQVFDTAPSLEVLIDRDKTVYGYDPRQGVYRFDYFGGSRGLLPLRGWKDFSVVGESLFGWKEGIIYRYDAGTLAIREYPLPDELSGADKISIMPSGIFVLEDGTLREYHY